MCAVASLEPTCQIACHVGLMSLLGTTTAPSTIEGAHCRAVDRCGLKNRKNPMPPRAQDSWLPRNMRIGAASKTGCMGMSASAIQPIALPVTGRLPGGGGLDAHKLWLSAGHTASR